MGVQTQLWQMPQSTLTATEQHSWQLCHWLESLRNAGKQFGDSNVFDRKEKGSVEGNFLKILNKLPESNNH